jgi:hypothetical protein
MGQLIDAAHRLMGADEHDRLRADQRFVEIVTFSSAGEIIQMLDMVLSADWIGFPVWARNLAFRLACLLEPMNAQLLLRAAADLLSFGPDWDAEARALEQRAAALTHDRNQA